MILPLWKQNEIMSRNDTVKNNLSVFDAIIITKQVLKNSKKSTLEMQDKLNIKLLNYIYLRKEKQNVLDCFNELVAKIDSLSLADYTYAVSKFKDSASMTYNRLANKQAPMILLPNREEVGYINDPNIFTIECDIILNAFKYIYENKDNTVNRLSYVLSLEIPLLLLLSELELVFKMCNPKKGQEL